MKKKIPEELRGISLSELLGKDMKDPHFKKAFDAEKKRLEQVWKVKMFRKKKKSDKQVFHKRVGLV